MNRPTDKTLDLTVPPRDELIPFDDVAEIIAAQIRVPLDPMATPSVLEKQRVEMLESWKYRVRGFNLTMLDGNGIPLSDVPERPGRRPGVFVRSGQLEAHLTKLGAVVWPVLFVTYDEFRLSLGLGSAPVLGKGIRIPKRRASEEFVAALERVLHQIESRAAERRVPFDRNEMPGIRKDFHAIAIKLEGALETPISTFRTYTGGLCKFRRGARPSPFYRGLFPEFFAD
jgi:hypothetical protein